MKSRYTRLALADLGEADAFIRRENPGAAHQVMQRIEAAIGCLASFPESGRPDRVAGTRELVVPGASFVVAYRPTANTVDILSVVHAARLWPSSFR